jgi:hypothetical protein
MRVEWRWALAAAVVLTLGVMCAESYTRLMAPYYEAITRAMAAAYPWKVVDVGVALDDAAGHGVVLRLKGEVRREREDPQPAVLVVSRVQVGEVIEAPIVFWTLVLVWPAPSQRHRGWRVLVAIPIFLGLEAITIGCHLLTPMAEASALLAGEREPLTLWDRWSQFLEAGGRFALETAAALPAVALTSGKPVLRPHPVT